MGSFPRFARSLCTDVPTPSGKIGRGLLSRFFLREGDVCAQANLYVANLNQFRSAFVRAPNFILFINFVKFFCRHLAVVSFAYLCFRVVGTASDFSRRGNTFLHKVVLFFVSGGVVPVFSEAYFSS